MKSKFPLITHINKKRAQENITPIAKGVQYTRKYREILRRNSETLKPIFDLPMAESFDRNAIALLLQQKGAESIRIYYGVDEQNQVRLILVPVDKHGKDIFATLIKRPKRSDRLSGALRAEDDTEEDDDEEDVSEEDEEMETASAAMSAEGPADLRADEDAQVVNSGQRCPHVCDETSDLNTDIPNE